ncbi:hypothetical protein [Bradyrhizobium genomosp. III]|uniref:hypothetical protein n=1 Tax=Bradyrhizobium genomosp. III TaxID=2683271 RepID=UPI00057653ED|nr:hypothetical protein [Bradyrhizobium sp. CCBAU 15635]
MRSSRREPLKSGIQALLILLGAVGAAWPTILLPQFRSAIPAKEVAAHIVADDHFKVDELNRISASMLAIPNPWMTRSDLVRSEALIRLRIEEESSRRGRKEESDRDAAAAYGRLKSSLALSPMDSFLWLMLYSIEISRNGFDEGAIGLLNESYVTGPLEGWIALRRNKLALAAFAALPVAMQARVVSEFAGLVDADFTDVAALNLMGVGWPQLDRLLAGVANINAIPREAFARRLRREGLKVNVPGVESDERLWR